MKRLNKTSKIMIITFFISVIFIAIFSLIGFYRTNRTPDLGIVVILILFINLILLILTIAAKAYMELIIEFFKADIKGKILLIIILLSFIFKAIYEIKLNK